MNFHGTNPNTVDYYLGYILVLSIGYSVIMLIQNFLKNRNEELGKMNITLDFYGAKFGSQVVHDSMTREQKDVRFKYLIVSMLVKSATWIKAPYMFALYNRIHGFTRSEIGYLLALDNFAAFFLGPILSGLADVYGRKKFCVLYCISIIVHVSLRVTGSRSLAVVAQIVTGISACLLDNVFESWLNFEANFLFPGLEEETAKKMKNSYLREIFTKQVTLDCFCSIVLTGVATILYAYYGILYPFYASIVLSFIAGLVIALWWQENNMSKLYLEENTIHNYTFFERTLYAWNKLKNDKALLSVGIIDSCFKISLILFLFIWTPLLEGTIGTTIHPGAIFVCFMLCRLIGSELFEILKRVLVTNSYYVSIFITLSSSICFLFAYYIFNFNIRLILFIFFDGLSGLFQPLFSSLRAQMIPEKNRSTILNFLRMPINISAIVFLYATGVISTYQICMICALIMLFASFVNTYLLFVHSPPDAEKRILKKTSEFSNVNERCKIFQNIKQ